MDIFRNKWKMFDRVRNKHLICAFWMYFWQKSQHLTSKEYIRIVIDCTFDTVLTSMPVPCKCDLFLIWVLSFDNKNLFCSHPNYNEGITSYFCACIRQLAWHVQNFVTIWCLNYGQISLLEWSPGWSESLWSLWYGRINSLLLSACLMARHCTLWLWLNQSVANIYIEGFQISPPMCWLSLWNTKHRTLIKSAWPLLMPCFPYVSGIQQSNWLKGNQ